MNLIQNASQNMTNLFGIREAVAPLAGAWASGWLRLYSKSADGFGSLFGKWSFRIST